MSVLSITLPLAFSFILLHLLWPTPGVRDIRMAIKFFLSLGMGLGLSSISYWLSLFFLGAYTHVAILADYVVFISGILICIVILRKTNRTRDANKQPIDFKKENQDILWWNKIPFLALGFWLVAIIAMGLFFVQSQTAPHGSWDAWAIWNMRARFLFRAPTQWIDAFSNIPSMTHSDYPLLIPATIARIWTCIGTDALWVPMAIAFLFTAGTVGLLVTSIMLLKNRNHGYVAGLVLLSLSYFTLQGAGQVADVPFGFFVLSTILLFFLKDNFQNQSVCFLAIGMMAGLSAWTKNEGLLFVVVVVGAHFIVTLFQKGWAAYIKELFPLLSGLLPILLMIFHFKMTINSTNDLVSQRNGNQVFTFLLDIDRYIVVAKAYLSYFNKKFLSLIVTFPLCYMMLKFSKTENQRPNFLIAWMIIFSLLSGYFMVYIITPHDLQWHLKTSLSRLYLHVIPSLIFVFFLNLNAIMPQMEKHRNQASGVMRKTIRM